MATVARTLRLFALILWVGGIVHFGVVLAPAAAHALNTRDLGAVIGPALAKLHMIGIFCGIAMLVSLRVLGNRAYKPLAQAALIVVMVVLTFVSNRMLLQPMQHERAVTDGYISALPLDAPMRRDFDNRHHWTTRVEGTVLLCGVALALLIAFEQDQRKDEA
ncbi:MAG: DUF4149 domain-containing protein [Acidobacteria bacterium]|nr:DUF4149 domain-containing protein [Acidobacteriota bacterium]